MSDRLFVVVPFCDDTHWWAVIVNMREHVDNGHKALCPLSQEPLLGAVWGRRASANGVGRLRRRCGVTAAAYSVVERPWRRSMGQPQARCRTGKSREESNNEEAIGLILCTVVAMVAAT
eukprot:COSAG02_NODE_236_length_27740_cov_49.156073_8_plen_119_part_00